MSRPYFKKRIHELEEIFSQSPGDPSTLQELHHELEHRKTRRAVALRRKVAKALSRLTSEESAAEAQGEVPTRSATTERRVSVEEGKERQEHRGESGAGAARHSSEPRQPQPEPTTDPAPEGHDPPQPAASSSQQDGPLEEPSAPDLSTPDRADHAPGQIHSSPPAESLLATWTTIEVLDPQPLPKPEELETLDRRRIEADEHPEPWSDPRYGPRGRQREIYWFVYLGELDLAAATAFLLEHFPDDSPEKPRLTRGAATMSVVVLDGEGRPAENRVFLSSFAWGYGKVRSGELGELADFASAERQICSELERRLVRMDEEGEILPVTATDLGRVTRWLVNRLNLPAQGLSLEPVAVRVPQWRKAWEPPEPELLNSFFLEDLARIRSAHRSGDTGPALRAFLSGTPSQPHTDVVRDPTLLDETLAPERIPPSRWPVRGRYPLVTMQQAALNHLTRQLSETGLVGINGPPGTGKTTLLRDVVAEVVLDRAIALAEFDDPVEAFSHVTSMSAGRGFLHLYRLADSLLGHELVVASSNNKAVENISREIPSIEAVADDFDPPLRYFSGISDLILGEGRGKVAEGSSWGLAAAVLGNSSNRHSFRQDFWWNHERSMQRYLRGIVEGWEPGAEKSRGADDDAEERDESPPEILEIEDAPRDRSEALARWRSARDRFRAALEHARDERRRLEEMRRALHGRAQLESELAALQSEIAELRERRPRLKRQIEAARDTLVRAQHSTARAVADRDALRAVRPGFFARLFSTQRYREWRDRMMRQVEGVEDARATESRAETALEALEREATSVETRLKTQKHRHEEVERRLADIRRLLTTAKAELGDRMVDHHFWSRPEEERQRLSPWLGEAFQGLRDDLFRACFELHRCFIGAAAPRLRHNLGAALELLKGRKLTEKQEPARRSLWASLFLVVPVISTTFASVARMFGPLGREGLGWLLIDEAGQAVPQEAVGAMWRSRRVVAVGDPMQIPPVVTLSQRLIDAIATHHGIDPEAWTAPRSSVQSLADRASWFGTTLLQEQGDVWVGAPLRVHRRCEDPMFAISNRIAYDGKMVKATPPGESPIGDVLGESGWFHVPGEQPGHWSPSEGELAEDLLLRIFDAGLLDPDVFFITPFRLVQARLRQRLRRAVESRTDLPAQQWVKDRVGTIHVVQGKEAEAVVLVLGAPSTQAAGARRWAGVRPNLLNVAVSRAKRRLYVVGHRESWKNAGVFRTLASELPSRTLAGRRGG